MPRTKIVCTLGPASETEDVLRGMIRAGMDVARINFSHGDHEAHVRRIELVRRLAKGEGKNVAVLQDLQGARVRVGEFQDGEVMLKAGETFTLTTRQVPGDEKEVTVLYPRLPQEVKPGDRVLLDDGLLDLEVMGSTETDVRCRVVTGGALRSRKGVTLPNSTLSFPSLTEKDKRDLVVGIEKGVDYIALSFVRRADDILKLKELLKRHKAEIPVIAKIEKHEAIAAFDEILAVSEGVMVARGDLGVEMPAEEVPIYQKMIIAKCNAAGKPVITATQMLESMIRNPRPTRAEASDVANAILDGTDAIMLSGETAVGEYPIESVQTMANIAAATEKNFPYREWALRAASQPSATVTEAISQAVCEIAFELKAKAIIASSESGYTVRQVAKHRPATPIVAVTPRPETASRLALVWGAKSLLVPEFTSTDEMIETAINAILEAGFVRRGETVVITAGVPLGVAGTTNMLKVHLV